MTWEDLQDNFYISVSDKDNNTGISLNTYYKRYDDSIGLLWVIEPPSASGTTSYLFTLAIIDEKKFRIRYLPTIDSHRNDEWETLRYCDPRNDFSEIEKDSMKYGISPAYGQIDKMVFDKLQPETLVRYIVTRVCQEMCELIDDLNNWLEHLDKFLKYGRQI